MFIRNFFPFKNKSTPLAKTPTIIIPSPAPYANFLPPYPHHQFSVKVTTPSVSYGYGGSNGEKKKSDDSKAGTISRASNRTNPFSDRHRPRASSSSTVNARGSTGTSRMASSFSNRETRAERRRTLLLHRQLYKARHSGPGTASRSNSYDILASAVPGNTEVDVEPDENRCSLVSSVPSDRPQLDDVDDEPIQSPEEAPLDSPSSNSILYDTNPEEEQEDTETFVVDQPSLQTNTNRSLKKRALLASRVPRPLKIVYPPAALPPAATTASTSSEPDSETQRLSVISTTFSEQSAASSNTFSFTTGCSSVMTEDSFESTDSTDSSTSTVRPRRDSTSSTSTIKPSKHIPVKELKQKSRSSSASTIKPQSLPAQERKPKSKSSSSSKLDLPPGTFFVSREECRDYSYIVYSDKEGELWGKMYPKHNKMRKSM